MGDQDLIAELNGFSIVDDLVWIDGRKNERVPKSEITMAAITRKLGIAFTGEEFRAR